MVDALQCSVVEVHMGHLYALTRSLQGVGIYNETMVLGGDLNSSR